MIDSTLIWKYHISYVCTNSPRTYICLWQTEMFVWGCAGGLMGSHVTESIFSNSARSYSQLANHKPYLSSWYPLDIKSLAWYGYNILVTCARGAQKAKVYFFFGDHRVSFVCPQSLYIHCIDHCNNGYKICRILLDKRLNPIRKKGWLMMARMEMDCNIDLWKSARMSVFQRKIVEMLQKYCCSVDFLQDCL